MPMSMKKLSAALSLGIAVLAPMPCLASEALTAKYACLACHQPAQKSVGPSWQQIAEKSRADGKTAAQLAASIRSGGSGRWGPMPMPPQPLVPDADLQALAAWILAYGK